MDIIDRLRFKYHFKAYQKPYKQAMEELQNLTSNVNAMSKDEIRQSRARYLDLIAKVRRHQDACERCRNSIGQTKPRGALQ